MNLSQRVPPRSTAIVSIAPMIEIARMPAMFVRNLFLFFTTFLAITGCSLAQNPKRSRMISDSVLKSTPSMTKVLNQESRTLKMFLIAWLRLLRLLASIG